MILKKKLIFYIYNCYCLERFIMGLNDKPALVNILIKKGIKSRHIIVTLLK